MIYNFNSNYMFDLPRDEDTYFELTVNVTVPAIGSSGYPFLVAWNSGGKSVQWGDGTSSIVSFNPLEGETAYVHTYRSRGTYTIKIPYTTTFYKSAILANSWTVYYGQPFCTQYSRSGNYTYNDRVYYYLMKFGGLESGFEEYSVDYDDFTLNGKFLPDYVVNNHLIYNPYTGAYANGVLRTLTIGDRVETISANAFGDNNRPEAPLDILNIACTTPPLMQQSDNGNNALKNVVGNDTIIRVPYRSLNSYKSVYPYSYYDTQIIGASL